MRTVDRVFSVLGCFSLEHATLSLQEIADQIGLAKSTTSRLTGDLQRLGYLTRGPDLRFSLSMEFVRLAAIANQTVDVRRLLRPVMAELVEATGETVTLNSIDGNDRLCVEVSRSSQPLFAVNRPGERTPLGLGGASLVLMAFMEPDALEQVIKPATREIRCTVKELRSILDTTRRQGYAVSHGGGIKGLSGISVPLFGSDGAVHYCLSVVVPTKRVTGHVIDLLKAARHAAVAGSRRLGGERASRTAREKLGDFDE